MRFTRWWAGCAAVALLSCSPTFNWREARLEDTPAVALLPCKPDHAARTVPLGNMPVNMRMMGCEAGGVQFAVAAVALPDPAPNAQAQDLLAQWRAATLANFAIAQPQLRPFTPKGKPGAEDGQALAASGRGTDGRALAVQAAWFRQGNALYQVLAYGEVLGAEAAETFLTGVALQ